MPTPSSVHITVSGQLLSLTRFLCLSTADAVSTTADVVSMVLLFCSCPHDLACTSFADLRDSLHRFLCLPTADACRNRVWPVAPCIPGPTLASHSALQVQAGNLDLMARQRSSHRWVPRTLLPAPNAACTFCIPYTPESCLEAGSQLGQAASCLPLQYTEASSPEFRKPCWAHALCGLDADWV